MEAEQVPNSPSAEEPVQMDYCLVLASTYRDLLLFHKEKTKNGRQKKLTKQDHNEVAQQVNLVRFDLAAFARQQIERVLLGQGVAAEVNGPSDQDEIIAEEPHVVEEPRFHLAPGALRPDHGLGISTCEEPEKIEKEKEEQ